MHRKRVAVLLLVLGGALMVLGVGSGLGARTAIGSAAVTWRGDFESGNLSQWRGPQEKAAGRVTVVSSPVRQGRYAARFEVDPGDNHVAGSGPGERAEVLTGSAINQTSSHEDWLAWSTMFDPSFQPTPNTAWNAFVQFHSGSEGGQASSINVDGDTLRLTIWGGDHSHPKERIFRIDRDRRNGIWYDFVLHIRWSSDPSVGFVELWMSKGGRAPAVVVRLTHLATLYSDDSVYLKQGYYRAPYTRPAVLYQDGMRRGGAYAAVIRGFPPGEWPRRAPVPRP